MQHNADRCAGLFACANIYVILYQANQLFPFVLKKTAAYVLLTSAHVHFFIVK